MTITIVICRCVLLFFGILCSICAIIDTIGVLIGKSIDNKIRFQFLTPLIWTLFFLTFQIFII